jgi:manganese-dependent inorganic pyrophosphatase
MKIYITGHKSPDLDSVVSAVAYTEFLQKHKRYENAKIISVIPGDANSETKFVFEKYEIDMPQNMDTITIEPTDAIVLVDHNEKSQRHAKVINEQIIEIVDHHKLNATFVAPIYINIKPLGSSSTLIYELFEIYGHDLSKTTANLLLAAILSDTQGLNSSTTTEFDSQIAQALAQKTSQNIEKVTFELFKAKSNITGLSLEEIVTKDYKIFGFGQQKVFINQVETVEPETILAKKAAIIDTMITLKEKLAVDQTYVVITDIMKINSQIIYATQEEKQILEEAFKARGENNVIDIGAKTSRKKDIAPKIERAIIAPQQ